MSVEVKTIATLIDELITADLKSWHQQEDVFNKSMTPEQRHNAAVQAHAANKRRCELMRALDARFGESGVLAKTF